MGLLTTDFINVLPISRDDFSETHMFHPIYNAVLDKIKSDKNLLPANNGGHISAQQAYLARGKELTELLGTEQLSFLFEKENCQWLDSNITEKMPEIHRYLTKELDIMEITSEKFANSLTEEFLQKQDDEWIINFYKYFLNIPSLWRSASGLLRKKPIIRLEDNSHKVPFDDNGKPLVYLPGNSISALPTVKRKIAENKEAREFLEELRLPKLDLYAEVIETILPKYQKDKIDISNDENLDDVKKIIYALKNAPPDKKEELITEFEKSYFLIVVNSVSQKKCWCTPNFIYLTERFIGSETLEKYFEGNPDIYFLDEMYNDFKREYLLELGCLDNVKVTYREPNSDGYVVILKGHGSHKRGLNGFDPDCEMNGLEYALEHITLEKALIIWNILKQHHQRVYGIIESSSYQHYGNPTKKAQASKMGELIHVKKWLPDKQGNFHKPSEIVLSDLPDNFDKESTEARMLAEKLRFKKDIEQEFLSQLPEEKKKKISPCRNFN